MDILEAIYIYIYISVHLQFPWKQVVSFLIFKSDLRLTRFPVYVELFNADNHSALTVILGILFWKSWIS